MGTVDKNCVGCAYMATGTGGLKTCDYLLIEGAPRGCNAGAGCTKRIKGKKRKAKL